MAAASASIEFVINNAGVDYKLLMSGARITSSQITDFDGTDYATTPNTHSFDDLTDVTITAANTGDVVYYSGSAWIDLARGASDQVLTASTTSIVWSASQGGLSNHNLFSGSHPDTVSQAVATGDIAIGGASASWDVLGIGGTNAALIVASGLPAWSTTLTSFFATNFTYGIDIITGRTQLSTPQVTTDQILVYDGSAASLVKTTFSVLTFTSNQISDYLGSAFAVSAHTHTSAGISDLPWQINGTQVTSVVAAQGLNLNANYIFSGSATGLSINAASNTISNIGFGEVVTDIITGQTTNSSLETTTDYVLVFDGSAGTLAKSAITNVAGAGGATSITLTREIRMEVPNDTVAYPDVFALGDGSGKLTGMWLPNSATSTINFKVVVPQDLHGTPAGKVRIYMLPRTTVATSTVSIMLSRLYVNDGEDADAAYIDEATVDVNLTASTADFQTLYEYDLTTEPTTGEVFLGKLTRYPGNANDDFTEDLFIYGMELVIEGTTS